MTSHLHSHAITQRINPVTTAASIPPHGVWRHTTMRRDPPAALTREQIRRVDQIAIDEFGIPGLILMENAGRGIAEVMLREGIAGRVVIACGKGNNAGDGLVLARQLNARGVETMVLLFSPPKSFKGDAAANWLMHSKLGLPAVDLSKVASAAEIEPHLTPAGWLVVALLGTGAKGSPSSPLSCAIEALNRTSARRLAIDLPSGLDCDTGVPAEPAFRATVTCTLVAPKVGFDAATARPYIGRVEVVNLGIPRELIERAL